MLYLLAKPRVAGLQKKGSAAQNARQKKQRFFIIVCLQIVVKLRKTTALSKIRKKQPFRAHFCGPGCDFDRFLGPGWEAKIAKIAFENASEKKHKKKSQRCVGMRQSSVMRWASGRGGRVPTSLELPPKDIRQLDARTLVNVTLRTLVE